MNDTNPCDIVNGWMKYVPKELMIKIVEDAPWIVDEAFIRLHAIDYVAHDSIPYVSGDTKDVYAFVKSTGRFVTTKRTQGISTTDLITRIIKDYDLYVGRNLERGISAASMNVSRVKVLHLGKIDCKATRTMVQIHR